MNPRTLQRDDKSFVPVKYVGMDLSKRNWKLLFGDGARRCQLSIGVSELLSLNEAVLKARERFGLPAQVQVVSWHEAGRDCFWLHRYLESIGVENVVVDSASIAVSRRKRRAKNDRLDAEQLLRQLIRYHDSERGCWSVVRAPSVAEEDARRLHRELERLKRECGAHRCRIQSLLVAQGIRLQVRGDFLQRLDQMTRWDGKGLAAELRDELARGYARYELVQRQIRELESRRRARLKSPGTAAKRQVVQLMELGSIGPSSA